MKSFCSLLRETKGAYNISRSANLRRPSYVLATILTIQQFLHVIMYQKLLNYLSFLKYKLFHCKPQSRFVESFINSWKIAGTNFIFHFQLVNYLRTTEILSPVYFEVVSPHAVSNIYGNKKTRWKLLLLHFVDMK